jgi:predicted SAM-dependent methyltransferase
MKLHLGCGKRFLKGYTHIDIDYHEHVDFHYNIDKLPMIEDDSVDLIYTCGVLEYFDIEEVIDVLKEWKRVLKKAGILRTSVPNFESIVKIYNNSKNIYAEGVLGPLFGRIEIKNNNNKEIIHHKIVYDYNLLKDVLIKSGFTNIKYFDPFEVFPEDYDDYSKSFIPYKDRRGLPMHLNIEAIKK